jgi:hypothetical protein
MLALLYTIVDIRAGESGNEYKLTVTETSRNMQFYRLFRGFNRLSHFSKRKSPLFG